jgi:hypothetical protein
MFCGSGSDKYTHWQEKLKLALRLLAMPSVCVVCSLKAQLAGSLRSGTQGVVATSVGLHVVPGAYLPLGIPNVPCR